jgi:hypothetical protein
MFSLMDPELNLCWEEEIFWPVAASLLLEDEIFKQSHREVTNQWFRKVDSVTGMKLCFLVYIED